MDEEIDLEEFLPWLVILIALAGYGLRVFLIGNKGMWLDETFSVWLANQSVADMLHWIIQVDQHPPLYYLLLHFWMKFNGDWAYEVRLLSAVIGAATIPVVYLIGKRLSGWKMGLAAAVLLAVSPFNIFYAQDARMYTLLTFNAAVAIYALAILLTNPLSARPIGSQFRAYLRAWRTSGPVEPDPEKGFSYKVAPSKWTAWLTRHRRPPIQTIETDLAWVGFIVFSAATMLTHNTAVFFILATNIFVLCLMLFQRIKPPGPQSTFQAPSFWNWVKAHIAIFLLWSPWIAVFIKQTGTVYQEFWLPKPTWDTILQTFEALLNPTYPQLPRAAQLIWILYAGMFFLGVLHYRKNIARCLFLFALFATPFLGELIVSLRRPVFLDRTLIWISVPLILLLAAGIAHLKSRILVFVAVAILGTNNVFTTSDYYRFYQNEDWSTAAAYVANFAQKDDLVLFNAGWTQIPFDYYFRRWEEQYPIQVERHGVPADMFDRCILEPIMTAGDIPRLDSLLVGHERVWLVYSHNWYTDPNGLVPQALAAQMNVSLRRDFNGGVVQLYVRP
jgi:mannosyltransferase